MTSMNPLSIMQEHFSPKNMPVVFVNEFFFTLRLQLDNVT